MTREDTIAMVQEAIFTCSNENPFDFQLKTLKQIEHFAALVAAAERERIIAANRPEIEKINAHIKALEKAVEDEREACAKLANDFKAFHGDVVADAIRARG